MADLRRSIQWAGPHVAGDGQPAAGQRRVTWQGLTGFVERSMDRLAEPLTEAQAESLRGSIERMSRQIEGTIDRRNLSPAELTAASRELRGWLTFFARAENIRSYVEAQKLAQAALVPAAAGQRRFPLPIRIYFRPMRGIYKIRGARGASILSLPTSMIAFDAGGFAVLARLIFTSDRGARREVVEQMTAEDFQSIQAELEALSGIVPRSRGAFYDLDESFHRVNAVYFGSAMPRPRLNWSRSFTGRKFGHYDWILDTVMVSRTLDSSDVPTFVVDFIVYHELLHKKHGLCWVNGRGYAHTAEFYREERHFSQYHESEATLERLARRSR